MKKYRIFQKSPLRGFIHIHVYIYIHLSGLEKVCGSEEEEVAQG